MSDQWFADSQFHWLSSSNVDGFSYNPQTRELTIQFHGGRRYKYFSIPIDMVEELATAGSPGGWFHANLKGAPFERL